MTTELTVVGRAAIAVGIAALAGLGGTVMVRGLALRLGFVSHPNPLIPQHTRPVAYLGGVGVALGVGAGLAAHRALGGAVPGPEIMLPAALFLVLGVIDDLRALAAGRKFLFQALIAALAVALGAMAPLTGIVALDAAASWFWILTLVNAFNLTDVCDGLLASLCVVMFAALALLDPAAAPAAWVIAATSLGFLALNRPPARIFLGDAGSHLLGFLAAALTLGAASRAGASPIPTLAAGVLLVAVPLFELIFLMVVRTRRGRAWWKGSPDHFSLRLQADGHSRARTDLIACVAAAIGCGAGLALPHLPVPGMLLLVAGAITSGGAAAAYLLRRERTPHPRGDAVAASSNLVTARGATRVR